MMNNTHTVRVGQAAPSPSRSFPHLPTPTLTPEDKLRAIGLNPRYASQREWDDASTEWRRGKSGYWPLDCSLARKRNTDQTPIELDYIKSCGRPSCPACARETLWESVNIGQRLELRHLRTYAYSFPAYTLREDQISIPTVAKFIARQIQRVEVIKSCDDVAGFAYKIEFARGPVEGTSDGRKETVWCHTHVLLLVNPDKAEAVADSIGASLFSNNPVTSGGLRYLLKPYIANTGFDKISFRRVANSVDGATELLKLKPKRLFWFGKLFDGRSVWRISERYAEIERLQKELEPCRHTDFSAFPKRLRLAQLRQRQRSSPLGRHVIS
jgi:hypothetical protein